MVTHDFADAAALAERVVVLDGRLRQLGTPAELLARPADRFVASLTGGNLLTGDARPLAAGSEVQLTGGAIIRSSEGAEGRVGVAIHPWDIHVAHDAPPNGTNGVPGTVAATTLHGGRSRVRIGELLAEAPLRRDWDTRAGHDGVRRLRARGSPPHPSRSDHARGDPVRLSARNQLAGTVTGTTEGPATTTVAVDVGGNRLVASITTEAARELGIAEGSEVHVIIKASDVILAVAD